MSDDRPTYRSNRPGTHSSSENSDGEEEDTPLWRQKKEKYFRKQKGSSMALSSNPPDVKTNSGNVPAVQRKKSNNIWGSVLTEQDLTQTLSKSAAVDAAPEISFHERNVESYDFTKKFLDKRRSWDLDDTEDPSANNKTDFLVSRMDTESRPVVTPAMGRSIIGYEDTLDRSKEKRDLRKNLSRPNSRKRRAEDSHDREQRSGVHDRLGVKKVTTTQLGEIDVSVDMEDSVLAAKIADILHEPKVELIERVATHMGKEVAIRILNATRDVEESGGMYTLDGSRRRTPGGVYLTLIKQQPEFNKDVRKLIFVEDVEEMMRHKRERRKKAKRKRKRPQKQGNDGNSDKSRSRSNSHSRSRSNSNSSLKLAQNKKAESTEAMEEEVKDSDLKEEGEIDEELDHKSRNKGSGRKSRRDESSDEYSDDYDDDRQKSNWSKPFNFEDELAAAKKLILEKSEKSKSRNSGESAEMMDAGSNEGQGQNKGSNLEMADLENAEANVVDIDIGT